MVMCRAYSIFKLMMTTIFTLTINCERCELTNWMLAVLIHSILAYAYHTYMGVLLNNIVFKLPILVNCNVNSRKSKPYDLNRGRIGLSKSLIRISICD